MYTSKLADPHAPNVPTSINGSRRPSDFQLDPQFIATKLDMPSLARDINEQNMKAAKQSTLRKYKIVFALGTLLLILVCSVVGVFMFRKRWDAAQATIPPPLASSTSSVPARLRDKPVPLIVPSSVKAGQSQTLNGGTASNWVTVSPASEFDIQISSSSSTSRNDLVTITAAYRPRMFPFHECLNSINVAQVSKISVVVDTAVSGQPDAYRIAVVSSPTPSITVQVKSTTGLAMALESFGASLVAGDSPCFYRAPVFDSDVQSAAFSKRALWVDTRNPTPDFDTGLTNIVKVAAGSKFNTLIPRLDLQYGMDMLSPSQRRAPPASTTGTVLDRSLSEAISRGMELLPDIDFVSASAWPASWTFCPELGTRGGLNLNLAPARDAQFTWWTGVRNRLGNKVSSVVVGGLFNPVYLNCLQTAEENQSPVIEHWARMFDGMSVIHLSAQPPPATVAAVIRPVVIVTTTPRPQVATPVTLPNGRSVLYLTRLNITSTPAAMAPVTVPYAFPPTNNVPEAAILELPTDLIQQAASNPTAETVVNWMFLVASKSWAGWAQSMDVALMQTQLDLFRTWVVA